MIDSAGHQWRPREEASTVLAKSRDIVGWQATMARLDAEEEVARQPRGCTRLSPPDVVAYLRSLHRCGPTPDQEDARRSQARYLPASQWRFTRR